MFAYKLYLHSGELRIIMFHDTVHLRHWQWITLKDLRIAAIWDTWFQETRNLLRSNHFCQWQNSLNRYSNAQMTGTLKTFFLLTSRQRMTRFSESKLDWLGCSLTSADFVLDISHKWTHTGLVTTVKRKNMCNVTTSVLINRSLLARHWHPIVLFAPSNHITAVVPLFTLLGLQKRCSSLV